jgi:glycosyltransferase involved in cell wall biosynthesis
MTLEQSRISTNGYHPELPLPPKPLAEKPGRSKIGELRVSVVIPARNEAEALPFVLEKIPPWVYEVILVDGLSVDETVAVARRKLPQIRVVHQSGRGKGNALREGFFNATGDVIVAIDADGSMDPGEIGRFVELLDVGFDYVKGSRMMAGGSSEDLTRFRRFGNWVFRTLTNVINGSRFSDLCYGYFAVRRDTVDRLDLRADGFEIETEINIRAHRAGLRIGEVPSSEFMRTHGTSQLSSFKDGFRILATIFRTSLRRQSRTTANDHAVEARVSGLRNGTGSTMPITMDSERPDRHLPRDSSGV